MLSKSSHMTSKMFGRPFADAVTVVIIAAATQKKMIRNAIILSAAGDIQSKNWQLAYKLYAHTLQVPRGTRKSN